MTYLVLGIKLEGVVLSSRDVSPQLKQDVFPIRRGKSA